MNQTQPEEELSLEGQGELASLIERHSRTDGKHWSAIPSLHLFRASCEQEPQFAIYEPALCMIALGSKLVMLAKESYRYDPRSYLLASVHLPIKGQILEATAFRPYLGIRLIREILYRVMQGEQGASIKSFVVSGFKYMIWLKWST